MAALSAFFEQVLAVLSSYRPVQDTLDILIVTLIIFELFKLIRKTRSVQIFKGLATLFVVYIIVLILDMPVMKFIFESIISKMCWSVWAENQFLNFSLSVPIMMFLLPVRLTACAVPAPK